MSKLLTQVLRLQRKSGNRLIYASDGYRHTIAEILHDAPPEVIAWEYKVLQHKIDRSDILTTPVHPRNY